MSKICRRGGRAARIVSSGCLKIPNLQVFFQVPALKFHFGLGGRGASLLLLVLRAKI